MTERILTPSQIIEAKALRKGGMAWDLIAREFGTTRQRIRRLIDPTFALPVSEKPAPKPKPGPTKRVRLDDGANSEPIVIDVYQDAEGISLPRVPSVNGVAS